MQGTEKSLQNCHCDPACAGEAIPSVNRKISRIGNAPLMFFLPAQKGMGQYVRDCFTRYRSFAMTSFFIFLLSFFIFLVFF
jgi:hypothetical protein